MVGITFSLYCFSKDEWSFDVSVDSLFGSSKSLSGKEILEISKFLFHFGEGSGYVTKASA